MNKKEKQEVKKFKNKIAKCIGEKYVAKATNKLLKQKYKKK